MNTFYDDEEDDHVEMENYNSKRSDVRNDNDGRDEEHHVDKNDEAKTCDAQTYNVNEDINNASVTVAACKPHASIESISSDGDHNNATDKFNEENEKHEVVSVPVITCQNRPMTRSITRHMGSERQQQHTTTKPSQK